MADVKISALPLASTPLAGTEVLPIVQSATTDQVTVANLTAGRAVSASSLTLTTTPLAVGSGGTGTATAFTAGSVVFAGTSGVYSQDNANFFWDGTNNRLGIGTASPTYKLDVNSPGNYVGRFQNSTNQALFLYSGSNLSGIVGESSGQNGFFLNSASNLAQIYTGGASRLTVDASGNLGLGVTPSAWGSGYKAIGINSYADIASTNAGTIPLSLTQNAYNNGTNWVTKITSTSKRYEISDSGFIWYNGASATAPNPITFTQAMTLDASGNLGVGTTSPSKKLVVSDSGNIGLEISPNDAAQGYTRVLNFNRGTSQYVPVRYEGSTQTWIVGTSGTTRAMDLDASGNLLVGTTSADGRLTVNAATSDSGSTSIHIRTAASNTLLKIRSDGLFFTGLQTNSPYNLTSATAANAVFFSDGTFGRSTSSRKYKTEIQDAIHGLSDVLNLRSVTYKGKNDGDKIFGGLIAEEVDAAGLTEFVVYDDEGKPDALHYGNMAGLFVKAIQELAAKVAELKAKI